jgi:hypothetical protein
MIADSAGNEITGTELIQRCGDADVKLFWLASDNKADGYTKNFKRSVKPMNLVMTLSRNGAAFSTFLGQLLNDMSSGTLMPNAWVAIVPQGNINDPRHADKPGMIFFAGRRVKLFS